MTFEQAYELTNTISSHAAFSLNESKFLWETLDSLSEGATLVEVGCQYGRSTSLLIQIAKAKNHNLILIDPFIDIDSGVMCFEMLLKQRYPFTMHCSKNKARLIHDPIDFLHIDGDHEKAGIELDCKLLLPLCVNYVAFHDYGRGSLPDVYPTVNKYMDLGKFTPHGVVDTLGIWSVL